MQIHSMLNSCMRMHVCKTIRTYLHDTIRTKGCTSDDILSLFRRTHSFTPMKQHSSCFYVLSFSRLGMLDCWRLPLRLFFLFIHSLVHESIWIWAMHCSLVEPQIHTDRVDCQWWPSLQLHDFHRFIDAYVWFFVWISA